MIDSHAHLELPEFDSDRDEVIARAKEAGVDAIVTIGIDLDDCLKAVEIADRYDMVYAAVGIHPHEVKVIDRQTYDRMRDLAARPTEAYQAYFTDVEALEACCDLPGPAPLDEHGRWRADFRAPDRLPRFLHVDLGLKHDACGLVMVHCEVGQASRLSDPVAPESRFLGDRRDAYPTDPEIFADLVCRFVAPEGGEVDFARIRELIADLRRRGFNLAQVSFDGWQSVDSRQILKRQGFRTALVSVDRDMEAYETLKEMLNEGRLRWYRYEPVLQECRGLELVGGTKVDHRSGGSKDVADAVAGAVSEAVLGWQVGTVTGRVV